MFATTSLPRHWNGSKCNYRIELPNLTPFSHIVGLQSHVSLHETLKNIHVYIYIYTHIYLHMFCIHILIVYIYIYLFNYKFIYIYLCIYIVYVYSLVIQHNHGKWSFILDLPMNDGYTLQDLENLRAKRPAATRREESHGAGGGRQPGTRQPIGPFWS